MRSSDRGIAFVCPNCNTPVDPTQPNAMMNAATNQWQHKDCWTRPLPPQPAETDDQTLRL